MQRKLVNSQINNFTTYQMYLRQLLTLAENVFEFENMPDFIDTSYLNKTLLRKGSIAFFKDEVLGLIALPYRNIGTLDVYGRPKNIVAISQNGYQRTLKQGEYVIMYDNNGRYPLFLDIQQYAERIAYSTRTADINIAQQKTPRVWKVPAEKEKSFKDMINNVDGFADSVAGYEDIGMLDDISMVLAPAPYVADKIDEHKFKDWSEFLRLIGISNLSMQKRERLITDEIQAQNGGNVASRFSRYEPRAKALKLINEKFGTNIKVKYYDGEPDMNDVLPYNEIGNYEDEEDDLDV